ncbi:anthranilate phosphoribosyltransferase [Komagataeibacter intermedius]|uniref:Anthranilate phosphoribosyltransferase n=2 Tax=Komagataeibacter intermedius TaxID=66229 RepID=A0A0N0MGC4_9PROT|nr:anthranilate phosphoribosyltransferase [Komagataeibacter intermedius]KPH87774.1 anthranilate phosphoribosyltransferase [Komagataeibacter intermedius AF2]MCF3635988.1 anthranilate phosphoribosyltransferase [Komagataeibacter intermedius]GAN88554.1 anthranilate phosphoribosyltransferase TrpD [Komagataeibacter intermedius TF2]GBQ70755.1 anthranilate phosphoribosyltransferase [Komagataeibacter intermedius NRIC 0521]
MASSRDSASVASTTFRDSLGRVAGGEVVAPEQARDALEAIKSGAVGDVPAIAFLTGLYMQGRILADPVELEAELRNRAPADAGMTPEFRDILDQTLDGRALDADMAQAAFDQIMDGRVSAGGLAAFLTALHMRGETVTELEGAVRAMRARMVAVPDMPAQAIDVCGTGGDGLGTLNVSTAVAFVLAGLGVPVVKHGNRALSSRSGATDVLQELGVPLPVDHGHIGAMVAEHNLAFLAATNHHPAMRHVGAVRRALGFRTIFNLLGPLCNPAGVTRQMVGVFSPDWLDPMVRTLQATGSTRVWAISGDCGEGRFIDELTLAGPNHVVILEDGLIRPLVVDAARAGLAPAPISAIAGGAPAHNACALRDLAHGACGAYRDTVLLNAAVALHVAGEGNNIIRGGDAIDYAALRENIGRAAGALDNGAVAAVLEAVRNFRADMPNRVTG